MRFFLHAAGTAAQPAFSQTGRLSGTVRDQKEGAVAGAKVSVRSAGGQVVGSQLTGNDGTYSFPSIEPGTYDVESQASGFKLSIIHGARVTAGENRNVDLVLTLETLTSQISVQGTADIGYRVDEVKVGSLPVMPLQDLPYSINVVSKNLIENAEISTVDQLFRINPYVEPQVPQTRTGSGVGYIRGFNVSQVREDGLYSSFPIIDWKTRKKWMSFPANPDSSMESIHPVGWSTTSSNDRPACVSVALRAGRTAMPACMLTPISAAQSINLGDLATGLTWLGRTATLPFNIRALQGIRLAPRSTGI
jgi:hypothetical protein